MEKDTHITEVIFRVDTSKDWKGTIYAILPHDVCDYKGNVTVFDLQTSHGGGDYNHMVKTSRLATESEYVDIKKCMEINYGYNLKVIKKKNHDKFLKSFYEVRGMVTKKND